MKVYIGTYSVRGSEGIYALDFDADTGVLGGRELVAPLHNPSFLALHPREPWLYSVSEAGGEGSVAAISLLADPGAGAIMDQQSTLGSGPCHLAVDPTGEWLVSANYGSGSVAVHPIQQDGPLGAASDLVQHAGCGPNSGRQAGPHAHSVTFDPSGRFVIAADLGVDKLLIYVLDTEHGKLVPNDPPEMSVEPGAGPRHFAFHPNGRYAYVINELRNTVVACSWDGAAGRLTPLQTLPTLPAWFTDVSHTADIHVHPSGSFLYGSNRGYDHLTVFGVDPATGLLDAIVDVSTGGRNPRNFALTPDGRWMLAANQDTDSIVVFGVTGEGEYPEQVGECGEVAAPVCIVFGG